MTPIQAKAIPIVLQGRDVMGAAQTGTGKTAAFSIPLLQRMLKHENPSVSPARHPVRALVLAPTRELADQVAENVKKYAKHTNLRSVVVFGGIDMKPQTAALKAGVEVLIATPGRLLDHIEAKNCVLNQVEYVVLDEADRMLDIGFLPDLQRILSYLPKARQTLLFSATWSASSRVGASTRARTGWRAGDTLGFSCLSMRCSNGIENAAVLPVPVWAAPMTSRPCRTMGIALAWMGVIVR
jgi:superfamily II DNA/RNA helicase